jgi:hypothetical protein
MAGQGEDTGTTSPNSGQETGTDFSVEVDEARRRIEGAKEEVRQGLHQIQERVRDSGRSAINEMRRVGRETGQEIRARGAEAADRQKNRAAEHIGNYGAAVKRAAEQLRSEHDDVLAGYADTVGNALDRAAGFLRNREVRDLVGEVESYVRRHPELILGGLFVAGIAAARFVKAASPGEDSEDGYYEESYGLDYANEEFGPGDEGGYDAGPEETRRATRETTAGAGQESF